jgi:hypothetical protein
MRVVNDVMQRSPLNFSQTIARQLLCRRIHVGALLLLIHDEDGKRRIVADNFQLAFVEIWVGNGG